MLHSFVKHGELGATNVDGATAGLLNSNTADILDQIILCGNGAWPVHGSIFNSISGVSFH